MPNALMAITGAFSTGGGIAAVDRLVFHTLAAAGFDIGYFSLMEGSTSRPAEMALSAQVSVSATKNRKVEFAGRVASAITRRRYDLVYCDHVNLASILGLLSVSGLCRYLVWLHGVEVLPPRPDFEGRLGLSRAWRCLASSEYTRQEVLKHYPGKNIAVCEPALDPVRNPLPTQTDLTQQAEPVELVCISGVKRRLGEQVILCVGRMSAYERYKGQDTLIEAFPSIRKIFPAVQLVLVGDGDDATRLRTLARGLGENQTCSIFMPGRVEQELLRRLYRKCAVFAMPSTGEGFGIVYLEAMSFAKPCLGGAMDAASGIIRNGLTGLICQKPHDPDEVANVIIQMLQDPARLVQMGWAGYELVQANYCFSHFQERFWKCLQE